MLMTGSILNAAGIVMGGILGLMLSRQFSAATQVALRGLMGVITVVVGLHLTWTGLNGNAYQIIKQALIMVMALTLGRFAGRLLHIQSTLNRLGASASQRFAAARPGDPDRVSEGFTICALLFCAGPLGPIGAVQDGLLGYWQPLAIKMVMDGLAAMGFVCVFGWGVLLSAIPVFVYQGTITLAVRSFEPFLHAHNLLDSISATSGMLVFCVALIVLELKKIQLADYLPSLVMAPLITWLWR
jgi:uncharacterized membrane protein YqgA involved in biofilm formation